MHRIFHVLLLLGIAFLLPVHAGEEAAEPAPAAEGPVTAESQPVGPAAEEAEDAVDPLEALEAVVIDHEKVEETMGSSALDDMVTEGRETRKERASENLKATKVHSQIAGAGDRAASGGDQAGKALEKGGRKAVQIREDTTRKILDANAKASAGQAFIDEAEEAFVDGAYEAGFRFGEAAGDEVYDTRGQSRGRKVIHVRERD